MRKMYEQESFYEQQLKKKGLKIGIMEAEYRKINNHRPYPELLKTFEKDLTFRPKRKKKVEVASEVL